MKAINLQLPARLKRVLLPGAGPPRPAGYLRLLIESSGPQCWYASFRSLRGVVSGALDTSAYEQISLRREVSIVFTSQGPVIYRYGRNSAADVSAAHETTRRAQFPKRS